MTQRGTISELSLTQAAKIAGKSKSTINRAIKSGKLSATRHDDGSYSIDGSELARVFPIGTPSGSERVSAAPPTEPTRTAMLEAENAALRTALDREREALDEARADRDAWRQQATALLASPPKRRGWWPWGRV
jgi:hypothetical protein